MPSITFRPCKPQDVEQAIPLIYSSGPDAFEYVFQNEQVKALDFLRYTFTRTGGQFSYANHYALLEDDEIVGIGSIFSAKKSNSFTIADGLNIFRFYKLNAPVVITKGLRVEQIIKLPKKNEIALVNLGIKEGNRGRGLGTQLIAFLQKAIEKNDKDYFVLDVSEENPSAKTLYEKLGFKETQYYTSTLKNKFSYVPNHFRMELR